MTWVKEKPPGVLVGLDDSDISIAVRVGKRRWAESRKNYRGLDADNQESENIEIIGALGECAAAKSLSLFWDGAGDIDVGPYQVKTVLTCRRRLFLPKGGKHQEPETIYISVQYAGLTGEKSPWYIRGWLYAKEILLTENLSTLNHIERNPVFVVENEKLHPMNTIPKGRVHE